MNITSMIFLINEINLPKLIDRHLMVYNLAIAYNLRFPEIEFEVKFTSWLGVETGILTGWSGDEELFTVNQYALSYQGERVSFITSIELLINEQRLPMSVRIRKKDILSNKLADMCKHIFVSGYDPNPKKLKITTTYTQQDSPIVCSLTAYYGAKQAFCINNISIDRELRQLTLATYQMTQKESEIKRIEAMAALLHLKRRFEDNGSRS